MTETFTPKNLLKGDFPVLTRWRTLMANAGALVAGTVLGKILTGAVTKSATKANAGAGAEGANTGNGTLTLDATTPVLSTAKAGVYKLRIIRAAVAAVATTPAVAAMKAIGQLTDPLGNILEVFDIPTTPGITIEHDIKFALLEGTTPFAITDGFDITVAIATAAGSGQAKIVDSTNTDGSNVPECVLLEDAPASTATQVVPVAITGEFAINDLVFGGNDTFATHEAALRALSIFGKNTLEA